MSASAVSKLSVADGTQVPAAWLTPRPGRISPIHRWFVFPHSFAPELVCHLMDGFDLSRGSTILDPFCGAGTTLVEAQRCGLEAVGLDLLPLATLASSAKTERPSVDALDAALHRVVTAAAAGLPRRPPGELLKRAYSRNAYGKIRASLDACDEDEAGQCVRLAVLSLAPRLSSLRADGGWLRRAEPVISPVQFGRELEYAGASMLDDLACGGEACVEVQLADARAMPLEAQTIDAVITSPPYPNRHDYTRVFAIELELGYGLGEDVKALRRQAIHSHPEAKPKRPASAYQPPPSVIEAVEAVAAEHPDPRIPRMLDGYFRDLDQVLRECRRVLKPGGTAAFVVGNARYCGVDVTVDETLSSVGAAIGFTECKIRPARLRGNSAQQMGRYGRRASRESVVLLQR